MVTMAVLLGGAAVVLSLYSALTRTNPGAAEPVPPLFAWRRSERDRPSTAAVQEWEALLLTGSTGGPRGRARLGRRLEPLVTARLAGQGTPQGTPAARAVLGAEWEFLNGGPRPLDWADSEHDDVLEAVDRLLSRLEET